MSEAASQAPGLDPPELARLAGGLVHELKNPLSTLSLQLGLLREEWAESDSPKAKRAVRTLDNLLREVQRLNEILEAFLRFARTDPIQVTDAALNSIVEQVVSFVAPEASARGLEIRTFLDLDLPPVRADVARVNQALLNLLINARQALEDRAAGRISVITRRDGEEAVVEVVDDGPGMDRETLERCFEVYFSTKRNGSGLGLATVRRIMEAHGGRVEIQSALGHGTRAQLRFPLGRG